jgi:hypothetical protein
MTFIVIGDDVELGTSALDELAADRRRSSRASDRPSRRTASIAISLHDGALVVGSGADCVAHPRPQDVDHFAALDHRPPPRGGE